MLSSWYFMVDQNLLGLFCVHNYILVYKPALHWIMSLMIIRVSTYRKKLPGLFISIQFTSFLFIACHCVDTLLCFLQSEGRGRLHQGSEQSHSEMGKTKHKAEMGWGGCFFLSPHSCVSLITESIQL